jgi:hypothetical protein
MHPTIGRLAPHADIVRDDAVAQDRAHGDEQCKHNGPKGTIGDDFHKRAPTTLNDGSTQRMALRAT